MVALADSGGNVASRSHFDPGHFTASAFVLDSARERLLLVFHDRLGRWLQPGGHIEPEDVSLIAAARREVVEETGIHELRLPDERPFDIDVHGIPPSFDEPAHEHFDVRFLMIGEGEAEAGDGVKEARWVDLATVAQLTSDASVRRAVAKLSSL